MLTGFELYFSAQTYKYKKRSLLEYSAPPPPRECCLKFTLECAAFATLFLTIIIIQIVILLLGPVQ